MSIQLKAGYGKVDITPSFSTPLRGYGNTEKRMHDTVLDPIYSICVAINDGEKTLLAYKLDLTGFPDEMVALCREELKNKYGIDAEYILFNSTHNHSSPDLQSPLECIANYKPILAKQMIEAASLAIADLDNASVTIGAGHVKGLNFVRRYLLSNWTYGGDNFGDFKNNTIVSHETEVDDLMQAVRFVRENKKDIVIVNWQGHPHLTGGSRRLDLSSDLVEYFRRNAEAENDVFVSFYQGCGGNLNSHSRIPEEQIYMDHTKHGEQLAKGLTSILENMRPVMSGKIRASMTIFEGPINHSLDHRVEDAQKVQDLWKKSTVPGEATQLALQLGFNSVYHAGAVIYRSKMPETFTYNIGAVSFGDVCIAWAPNELYDTTGKYLKATSPFEMTFVCGYTNGAGCYMPTIKAFAHGGYGCDTCRFGPGVIEKMTGEILNRILDVKA